MSRLMILVILAFALTMDSPALAAAQAGQSPVNEVGVDGAHYHHVMTPHGCVAAGAVAFELDPTRGLHGASLASGPNHGTWHGGCP
jgi:hypothetical protein